MMFNKKAFFEGAKAFLRYVVFTAISAAFAYAMAKANLVTDPAQQAVIVMVLTSLQTGVDKYVHKNENINSSGLLPF